MKLVAIGLLCAVSLGPAASAQIDAARAQLYFDEASTLCQRDAGRLWGVSLCGPMVFADAATQTVATNQAAPEAPRPRALGFANSAMDWGGQRWSTYIWSFMPADDPVARGRLMLHELFHRVQPQLGLMAMAGSADHLDSLDGRYWLMLEWRALRVALAATDDADRRTALADTLGFRTVRRAAFPGATDIESADEIREGLAQYTGIVTTAASPADAVRAAIEQLTNAESEPTFVRTFAYASGPAYGLLLDVLDPDWRVAVTSSTDLGALLAAAAAVTATTDGSGAALRYDGAALRATEERRELDRQARVAELTGLFIDGPVVTFPRTRGASFITTGAVPIPGAGTVFTTYRANDQWGSLAVETGGALVRDDGIVVPAPADLQSGSRTFAGEGWTATLAEGWHLEPGARAGDYVVTPPASR